MTQPSRRVLPEGANFDAVRQSFVWDIPEDFNIAQACLLDHAARAPDATALIDCSAERRVWTYAEIADASLRLANIMQQAGVTEGDRIAILLPQRPETLISHFAAHSIGAVSLPLFVLFGATALEYRLRDSGAKVLVTQPDQVQKVLPLLNRLPELQQIMVVEDAPGSFWDQINQATPLKAVIRTKAEDPAVMIYTSGTTGDPKGVLHAHRFVFGHLPSMEMCHPNFPTASDIGWTPADWAWIGGLMDMAMPCFYYGVPLVAKRFDRFSAKAAFDLIGAEAITRAFLPPTAMKMMRQDVVPAGAKLASISSGGEPLTDDLITWADKALGAEVNELYGQTECNLCVSTARAMGVSKPGTMGQAVPGFTVEVLDDAGSPVQGAMGRIAVHRGTPSTMLAYWNKPEASAQKFVGDYLVTGDLGIKDADGYLSFVARDDDVITSAGYRIGPTEIEAALARDPDVILAAAVAVPDPVKGHVVGAFVTVAALSDDLEARLIARVRSEVSPHMAPRWVRVIEEMPMTTTGKIQRRILRDQVG